MPRYGFVSEVSARLSPGNELRSLQFISSARMTQTCCDADVWLQLVSLRIADRETDHAVIPFQPDEFPLQSAHPGDVRQGAGMPPRPSLFSVL